MALPQIQPVVATVNRRKFRLRLMTFHNGRAVVDEYRVAIGAEGHATRRGDEYRVVNKTTTPDWRSPGWATPPDMIAPFWTPDYAAMGVEREFDGFVPLGVKPVPLLVDGKPVPNPANPFDGGFISFEDDDPDNDNNGQGFHGTKFDPRLGTRASHGCVRMAVRDLRDVYDRMPVGTVVVVL